MAENAEEKIRKQEKWKHQVNELTLLLDKTSNPEIKSLLGLLQLLHLDLMEYVIEITTTQKRLTSADNEIERALISLVKSILQRLNRIEHTTGIESPELKGLIEKVDAQQQILSDNKETLEEIALLRKKGWDAMIKKFEEKKGKEN